MSTIMPQKINTTIFSCSASCPSISDSSPSSSVHRNTQLAQLNLRRLDLAHQLLVRLGAVVEGQHAPAEAEEQVRAEGDEGPEGEL